jgi:HupE/UreJ protein
VKRFAVALALLLGVLVAAIAEAHARPLSYSFWTLHQGGADIELQIAPADLAALGLDVTTPEGRDAAGQLVQQQLVLQVGSIPCTPLAPPTYAASGPWTIWRFAVSCSGAGPRRISVGFGALLPSAYRHLLRFDDGQGHVVDRVLGDSHDAWVSLFDGGPSGSSAGGSTVIDYLVLGVEHLLTGWDHVVFLAALLVLARKLRDVVALVTSFTLAHSTTLALAALGIVRPNQAPVEALIGFSIALVGTENVWLLSGRGRAIPAVVTSLLVVLVSVGAGVVTRATLLGLLLFSGCHFGLLRRAEKPAGLRIAIAFVFGLIHGFGFAGVMATMDLPRGRLASALFGFNIGVEVGQLAIVVMAWPLLRLLARVGGGRWSAPVQEAVSAAVCGAGVFWFLVRSYG